MKKNETFRIRPAGRHILTIGRDLIQDRYAAIVELVKNAYDADSPDVDISFKPSNDDGSYSVTIKDHGHGMSRDTVINKWMVPSTDDKLRRRESPAGRIMQGNKGIGRYAASILGQDLLLETITHEGEKTTLYIEWDSFEKARLLDDVEILIETVQVKEPSGTILTINSNNKMSSDWDEKQQDKLTFELKKLMSPVSTMLDDTENSDTFRIQLSGEEVRPYPIIKLYDYKISGKIKPDGQGILTYSIQKVRNAAEETILFDAGNGTGCGTLVFDIRVYDREKEAIESLIGRGLTHQGGNYFGKREARQLLNEYNGIGVYRNGFRIRPLGDSDFDWLKLNKQRIQNPSMRIGSNQVIGYVQIESADQSDLIEKSARDGLHENTAYERLKEITKAVIGKLEEKRFGYRRKAGLSRPALKIEQELERLFSFAKLRKNIKTNLAKKGVNQETTDKIIEIIDKDEADKSKMAEDIRQAVAVYQGQATLGKIINFVLHEGRRPLSYFKNQIPNLRYWYDSYLKTKTPEAIEKFISIAEGIGENADVFVKLFKRLDPLAMGKRSAKKSLPMIKHIKETFAIFETAIKKDNVTVIISGKDKFRFECWPQDIHAIFTNLIDNSIYWMSEKEISHREIKVDLETEDDSLLYIDYRDTGPGIETELIISEVIFEPEFTTKPEGTGLGLAIAGEAASRNNLELKAYQSDTGAYFRLEPKTENK